MRKFFITLILLVAFFSAIFFSCMQSENKSPEKTIAQILIAEVDSFASACNDLQKEIKSNYGNEKHVQDLFLRARRAYKTFEWASEYFVPATSRYVNGPPVPEVEISGQVLEPAGLQVIEPILFPHYDSSQKNTLDQQLILLQANCAQYKLHFENIPILDWQVFDAAKLEIFRIETLGVTGFDNPLTLQSMQESISGLRELPKILGIYAARVNDTHIYLQIRAATDYLEAHPGFNQFDRAEFISAYCNPISISIDELERKLNIAVTRYNRLLNQDAKTLFDTSAFNVNAYAPDQYAFLTNQKIALGKILFSDPSLSGTGTRSCQSCHQPEKAFSDGLVKNTMIDNHRMLARNTPTLVNAALQPSLFYDLRVRTLEDQSRTVVQSVEEMHGSIELSVQKLWQDTAYRRLFSEAFPKKNRNSIDTLEVMNAIGSYIRSLVKLNSRFDEYMRGDNNAMNTDEIRGFNLFMGKAKCGTCHYMPLFSGTFPPRYIKIESEVIGVPKSKSGNEIDPDLGRFNIIKSASFMHAFKTPTVRNASLTSPYMHNGVFRTLKEVMDFYNKGGGVGLGIKIDNQTLPFDKLDLTEKEEEDIIAFIKSLDSR